MSGYGKQSIIRVLDIAFDEAKEEIEALDARLRDARGTGIGNLKGWLIVQENAREIAKAAVREMP